MQVFQPMLMQYFTYEELKDIKKQVIAQHCSQQQWDCAAEVLKGFTLWSQAEELQKAFKYADHEKTDYGEYNARTLNIIMKQANNHNKFEATLHVSHTWSEVVAYVNLKDYHQSSNWLQPND